MMMSAFDEVRAEAHERHVREARDRALYGGLDDVDAPPEVLAKRGEVLRGTQASPLADKPISTGDPVLDEWEREEFADNTPIKVIDGPAKPIAGGPGSKALARYSARE